LTVTHSAKNSFGLSGEEGLLEVVRDSAAGEKKKKNTGGKKIQILPREKGERPKLRRIKLETERRGSNKVAIGENMEGERKKGDAQGKAIFCAINLEKEIKSRREKKKILKRSLAAGGHHLYSKFTREKKEKDEGKGKKGQPGK